VHPWLIVTALWHDAKIVPVQEQESTLRMRFGGREQFDPDSDRVYSRGAIYGRQLGAKPLKNAQESHRPL